jgi:hypothetical protein
MFLQLFWRFFVVITVVIGFIVDVPDPGVMQRPPPNPNIGSPLPPLAHRVPGDDLPRNTLSKETLINMVHDLSITGWACRTGTASGERWCTGRCSSPVVPSWPGDQQ